MTHQGPAASVGPAPSVRPSRCLGCAPTILATVSHTCGGNRIPTHELGWYCDCPEPECRRRQAEQPGTLRTASTVNTGG